MSLWLQSLEWCLEEAETDEQALACYEKHLAMPIGRELQQHGRIPGIMTSYHKLKAQVQHKEGG